MAYHLDEVKFLYSQNGNSLAKFYQWYPYRQFPHGTRRYYQRAQKFQSLWDTLPLWIPITQCSVDQVHVGELFRRYSSVRGTITDANHSHSQETRWRITSTSVRVGIDQRRRNFELFGNRKEKRRTNCTLPELSIM